MNAVLSVEEEISKYLLSKGAKEWGIIDIQLGILDKHNLGYTELEKVLEEMGTQGKLEKTYLVVYKGKPGILYDSLEEIPDMTENPICEDWEPEEISKGDVNIVTHYGHVDWKPHDPNYWKCPPFVYKEEHYSIILEYWDSNVLAWNGHKWFEIEPKKLKLGDIWKPYVHDPPSEKLLQEARKVSK